MYRYNFYHWIKKQNQQKEEEGGGLKSPAVVARYDLVQQQYDHTKEQ